MQRLLVIDCDLFARIDITQREEDHMAIDRAHIGIRFARVIDVMRAVPSAAAVDAPNAVNVADAQFSSMGAALSFKIRNALASVFSYLASVRKINGCETASAVNG